MVMFSEIEFSYTDAEEEALYHPEIIEKCFVDIGAVKSKLEEPQKFLVYANKGAGKSTLAHKVYIDNEGSQDAVVHVESLQAFDYGLLSQIDALPKTQSFFTAWKYIIFLKLLELLGTVEGEHACDVRLEKTVADLKSRGVMKSDSIASIVETTTHKGVLSSIVKILACHYDKEVVKRVKDPAGLSRALEGVLTASEKLPKLILFLDGIDFVVRFGDETSLYLADLINAVRDVNLSFYKNKLNVKVIILVRHELLSKIAHPDLGKRIADNGIYVGWFEKKSKAEDYSLMKVIDNRMRMAGFTESLELAVVKWFPERIAGRMPLRFLLDHTRYLPRDIVKIFYCLQELKREPPFSENDVFEALGTYSDWFFQELMDSLAGLVDDKIINSLPDILTQCGQDFTDQDFYKAFKRHTGKDYTASSETLAMIFNTSWVGNKWQENGKNRWNWKSRKENCRLDYKKPIHIHPGIASSLNIR